MDHDFKSALIKLTAWYMLIIVCICVSFSLIIYQISSNEFDRRLPAYPNRDIQQEIDPSILEKIRAQRANESRADLAGGLIVVNVTALALGGIASYFLARRTLRPIEEAAEAQGRFISDASHELRTPLSVMQSEIEVTLRRSSASKQDLYDLAQSNLEEVNKLRSLSDRLLQLSTGGELELGPVVIEESIIDGVTPHLDKAAQKHIEVINKTDRSVARANQAALADCISILVDNAIKYSPHKTQITLRSYQRNKYVFIEIADQGYGISPEDAPHIFERFYRADLSRSKANVEGHGLGLSIAQQIISLMDGEISVESVPKKGTTFAIRLDSFKPSADVQGAQRTIRSE